MISFTCRLPGPICGCTKQTLKWKVGMSGGEIVWSIYCPTCRNVIEHTFGDKSPIIFKLDVPYPEARGEPGRLSVVEETATT